MKTDRSILMAGLLLAATTFIPFTASADSGSYIGVGFGNAGVDIALADADFPGLSEFDEDDTGYKIFAGYNFDLPAVTLGVEGGYTDFGSPALNILGEDFSISPDGWNVWGLAAIEVGPVDLYGKVGMLLWDAELAIADMSDSDDGSDVGYGVGLRFNAGPLQIRGEYEMFEIDEADLTMISIGVAYNF